MGLKYFTIKDQCKGFSLIEVLITGLLSTIVIGGTSLYIWQATKSNSQVMLQSNAQTIIYNTSRVVEEEIKKGSAITFINPLSSTADETMYEGILIYSKDMDDNLVFAKGFCFVEEKEIIVLYTCDNDEVLQTKLLTFKAASFTNSWFIKYIDQQKKVGLEMNLLMKERGSSEGVISGEFKFYAICRN